MSSGPHRRSWAAHPVSDGVGESGQMPMGLRVVAWQRTVAQRPVCSASDPTGQGRIHALFGPQHQQGALVRQLSRRQGTAALPAAARRSRVAADGHTTAWVRQRLRRVQRPQVRQGAGQGEPPPLQGSRSPSAHSLDVPAAPGTHRQCRPLPAWPGSPERPG